jgi:hypothetical protein
MPDPKLLAYIQAELAQGVEKQTLVNFLLSEGWQQAQLDQAFAQIGTTAILPVQSPAAFTGQVYAQPPVEQMPAEQAPIFPSEEKNHKGLIIGLAVLLILFIVASLIFSATAMFAYGLLPIKNYDLQNQVADVLMQIPFMPKTARFVLASSATAHLKVTKMAFDASIAADSSSFDSILGSNHFDAEISGAIDYTDTQNILATLNAQVTKDFSADLMTKSQIIYFRINSIPALVTAMLNTIGVSQSMQNEFINKWFFADTKPLNTNARAALNSSSQDQQSQIQQSIKNYLDAFNNPDVLKTLTMTTEKLNGTDVYHLNFSPDDSTLDLFWNKYTTQNSSTNNLYGANYKISDTIKNFVVDIWIDRSQYLIQKSSLKFTIKTPASSALGVSPLGMLTPQNQEIPVAIVVDFSHFNEPVIVNPPANPVDINVFIKQISAQLEAQQAQRLQAQSHAQPTPTPSLTIPASSLGLTLKTGQPGKTVILTVANASEMKSIDYELTYLTGQTPRALIGHINIVGGNPVSQEIVLGSCADVCHYDSNITNLKISLTLAGWDGNTYHSEAPLSD